MEYKDFNVHVLDKKIILATLPSGVSPIGAVQMDDLGKRIINVFHSMLAAGDINRDGLEVFGSLLYTMLFNEAGKDDLNHAFRSTYDKITKQKDTGLRIVLEFETEAEYLATLPWEYLYYPDTAREKGFYIATRTKLILGKVHYIV